MIDARAPPCDQERLRVFGRCVLEKPARIVFLNGVGSVGKSSIAKALQAITADPFLHVEMDAFLQMLPEASFGRPDGVTFETIDEGGKPSVIIRTGPMASRVFRGMRHAIAALAAQGNNLIIDEVLLGPEREEYIGILSPFEVFLVGVFAPLEILEARELQRGDRLVGLARWQYDRVHKGMTYDLELDTSSASPTECAHLIKRRFRL
jgi:chloramphenicol 3-O phosphotransferase